jgi:mono/diheme cytochrome c family protein
MRKWVKFAGSAVALLVAGVAVAIAAGEWLGQRRAHRKIDLVVAPVAYRGDIAAVERGRYLYSTRGCTDCHGDSGGGRTLVDDGHGTHLAGPNITLGNPAIAAYREVDWVRSIRHGVGADQRPLRLMPSEDFNRLTDDDLAAIVAYVRQLPPAHGREHATLELPLPARVLYGFGAIPEAVEKIDHRLPPSAPVAEAANVEHGAYVAQACKGCHGATLAGGRIPGAPPQWPPAARLAPGDGSVLARYPDAASFMTLFRSGKRPDGRPVAVMPFASLGRMSDVDLQALYLYLKSLRPAT